MVGSILNQSIVDCNPAHSTFLAGKDVLQDLGVELCVTALEVLHGAAGDTQVLGVKLVAAAGATGSHLRGAIHIAPRHMQCVLSGPMERVQAGSVYAQWHINTLVKMGVGKCRPKDSIT